MNRWHQRNLNFLSIILLSFGINSNLPAKEKIAQVSGHYTYGHEVNTFQACNDERVGWVVGKKEILDELVKKYNSLMDDERLYKVIYIKLKGRDLGPPREKNIGDARDGFASNYDHVFEVLEIIEAHRFSPDDCKKKKE